ncbi:MAG: ankyrin repeat domain-containing protein [Spirochaetia bacterium]|jgi:ankyrin repeat protein
MKKRIVVVVGLAVLLAASAYAQTTDFHFFALVEAGTPQDVQAAISKGLDVNAKDKEGYTLLMHAANNQNPLVITTLLKAGADINARDTAFGGTALVWAAGWNQNPEVITVLLAAGADINAMDNYGRTPLMAAARDNRNPEVLTTLLKAGADGKVKNNTGKTAFDLAQNNRRLKGTDALKQLEEATK